MPNKSLEVNGFVIKEYMSNVKVFRDQQAFFYDKNRFFWAWIPLEKRWDKWDEIDVLNCLDNSLKLEGSIVVSGYRNNYLEACKWVGRRNMPQFVKDSWVQFNDQIIDIASGEQFESSSEYFTKNPIPWDIGDSEDTPNIDRLFEDWVGKDYVKTLYEIVAFSIVPSYFIHRVFCFIGSGLNGKSCFMKLLRKFIGESNGCSVDLDFLLVSRFEKARLYGKLYCQIGETNFNEMKRTSVLKALSGQDSMGFEFKNKELFDSVNYAKLIISTNSLPPTSDKTEGFYRRWMIINFYNKFNEKRDVLAEIPDEEYKNLARKSLRIAKELWVDRSFTNEGTIAERTERYEDLSNPLKKFVDMNTEEDTEGIIYRFKFKQQFELYCKENSFRTWTDVQLNKAMNDMEHVGTGKKRIDWSEKVIGDDGKLSVVESVRHVWCWIGIRWKKDPNRHPPIPKGEERVK